MTVHFDRMLFRSSCNLLSVWIKDEFLIVCISKHDYLEEFFIPQNVFC